MCLLLSILLVKLSFVFSHFQTGLSTRRDAILLRITHTVGPGHIATVRSKALIQVCIHCFSMSDLKERIKSGNVASTLWWYGIVCVYDIPRIKLEWL